MTTSFTDKKAVTTVSPEARDAWFKWQLTPPVPTSWELPEEAREDFEDAIMLLLLTGEDASEYADYLNDCLEEFLGESQVKGDFYHDIEQYAVFAVFKRTKAFLRNRTAEKRAVHKILLFQIFGKRTYNIFF